MNLLGSAGFIGFGFGFGLFIIEVSNSYDRTTVVDVSGVMAFDIFDEGLAELVLLFC